MGAAFSKEVRQYRRVGALSVLAGIVNNKVFRQEHSDEIQRLLKDILPKVSDELNKIQIVDDTTEYRDVISKNLEVMAKSWPSHKAFTLCKKQLLRLLKNWNLKVDFSTKSVSNSNRIMKSPTEE